MVEVKTFCSNCSKEKDCELSKVFKGNISRISIMGGEVILANGDMDFWSLSGIPEIKVQVSCLYFDQKKITK